MTTSYFTKSSMKFLSDIAENNNRDWFAENKHLYEENIRTPAFHFITDMADELAMLSTHFRASPKKVGGSLMRIFRDVRFGKDKRPYKTNIGIHFRHAMGKDVHAPGFYVHIEPGDCFIGVGLWRPDSLSLGKVRDRICEQSDQWTSVIKEKGFKKYFQLRGEGLKTGPRGYAKDHPLIADLKRKDFIAVSKISDASVLNMKFKQQVVDRYHAANNYMKFLCHALELQY